MVSDRTAAVIRASVAKYLPDTCMIQRERQSRGSMNEVQHGSYDVIASDVACRLIREGKRSGTQAEDVGSQEALIERYRLVLPVGTDFDVDDQVIVTDHESAADLTYQVVSVEERLSNRAFTACGVSRVR